ncbi:MAG: Gfo/Idh/MocA family oxidoreductase [Thermodesulfobacteriota bacterium]|nr:Gfo/Idh/MocA family oxidoreductase [Thermodesulfobacteriota bacterium]
MSKQITMGVIGCGYWGPKLVREFYASHSFDLKYVCDRDPDRLNKTKAHYPTIQVTDDCQTLFRDTGVDAIAIATPVSSHYELAKKSLQAGKHTWVEKPLTATSGQAEDLIETADRNRVTLHVDHTFIYTPAVRKIKEIYEHDVLGQFYYFDSVRVNLGLFQHDVNVVWDLAPHDLSILKYVVGREPKSVAATGRCHIRCGENLENMAYITVNFEDHGIGHFHVNWLSPVKIRQILISGSKKMLIYNDMESVEKIKVYDAGVDIQSKDDIYHTLLQYRTGDMYSPKVENRQALQVECAHFFDCIVNNRRTDTSGEDGLYVVRLLEAANESIRRGGKLVEL